MNKLIIGMAMLFASISANAWVELPKTEEFCQIIKGQYQFYANERESGKDKDTVVDEAIKEAYGFGDDYKAVELVFEVSRILVERAYDVRPWTTNMILAGCRAGVLEFE